MEKKLLKTVKKMQKKESIRQIVHILAGLAFILVLIYLGRINLIAISLTLLIIGSLLINLKLVGSHIPILHDIGDSIERENARFPGWGAAWYLIGVILLGTFLNSQSEIITGIYILSVCDGIATFAGIHGTYPLPYNRKKTLEGSVGFFLSALAAYFIIGPKVILLAVITTVIESLDLPLDDNFTLPLACAIYLYIF